MDAAKILDAWRAYAAVMVEYMKLAPEDRNSAFQGACIDAIPKENVADFTAFCRQMHAAIDDSCHTALLTHHVPAGSMGIPRVDLRAT